MKSREHTKRGVGFGLRRHICEMVNRDKDAPSQAYPGCIHHGYNHGVGTNAKYGINYGLEGFLMSVLHGIDDRTTRKCKNTIPRERIRTWHLGKGLQNLLCTGKWWL